MPQLQMTNSDLSRLINSDEVQSKVLPPKQGTAATTKRANPLKAGALMAELNPYAAVAKKHFKDKQAKAEADKAALRKARREGKGPKKAKRTKEQAAVVSRKKTFYGEMVADDS
jgi:large subunit ribosomal protein L4e